LDRTARRVCTVAGIVASGAIRAGGARCGGRYRPVRSRWLHPGQQHGRRWPSS